MHANGIDIDWSNAGQDFAWPRIDALSVGAAVAALLVLLGIAAWQWSEAERQRQDAEHQARIAVTLALAAQTPAVAWCPRRCR